MTNISHASLTGAEVHEPKGADTAHLGEVYISNGTGSGSWGAVGTSSFTGMIADFTWPVVQAGWLELNGSDINTTTYSALYNVMTIQSSGTRVSGSAIVTGIPSTDNLYAGYYAFGAGIAAGTTIVSIFGSQVTLSANASSTGTSNIVFSPWFLNTGTIRLPNTSGSGRYRRSRTALSPMGAYQADQNRAHTHPAATCGGTTANQNADHTHTFSATSGTMSANATHTHTLTPSTGYRTQSGGAAALGSIGGVEAYVTPTVSTTNTDHTHSVSGTSSGVSAGHSHTFSGVTSVIPSDGESEARPLSLVVMTCVKT